MHIYISRPYSCEFCWFDVQLLNVFLFCTVNTLVLGGYKTNASFNSNRQMLLCCYIIFLWTTSVDAMSIVRVTDAYRESLKTIR